jgi:hypothetical protein
VVASTQVFLVAEIRGDRMVFNAISRAGRIVDSGVVVRQELPSSLPTAATGERQP